MFGFQDAVGDSALTLTTQATTVSSGPIGNAGQAAYVFLGWSVSAITGTGPSVTFSLDESADGTTWTAVPGATSAAISAAGSGVVFGAPTKNYVRVTATIGGTGPAVTAKTAVLVFSE